MTEQEWMTSEDPAAMLAQGEASRSLGSSWPHVSDRKLRLFAVVCCRQVWHLLTDPRSRKAVEIAERFADGEATEGEMQAALAKAITVSRTTDQNPLWMPARACEDMNGVNLGSLLRNWQADSDVVPPVGAALLRDIVGNPCRPVTIAPEEPGDPFAALDLLNSARKHPERVYLQRSCLTPTVLSLVQAAYEERPGRWFCVKHGPVDRAKTYRAEGGGHGHTDCWQKVEIRDDGSLDPFRLMLVAEALEEAGCTSEDLLRHLRGWERCPVCLGDGGYTEDTGGWDQSDNPIEQWVTCECMGPTRNTGWIALRGQHVRGCWPLDLVLGKE